MVLTSPLTLAVPATMLAVPAERQARKRPAPSDDDDAEDDSGQGDSLDEDDCWHRHRPRLGQGWARRFGGKL
jgi:hypothetical protein